MLCCVVLCCVVLCCVVLRYDQLRWFVLRYDQLRCAALCRAVLHYDRLRWLVLRCALLRWVPCAALRYIILCYFPFCAVLLGIFYRIVMRATAGRFPFYLNQNFHLCVMARPPFMRSHRNGIVPWTQVS